MADTSHLSPAVRELAEAIRLTREYVGEELLPPVEGWSWYDALRRWAPEYLPSIEPPTPVVPGPDDMPRMAEGELVFATVPTSAILAAADPVPPTITIQGANGHPLVTIRPDGTLEFGEGYDPDEAARLFWDALRTHIALGIGQGEGEARIATVRALHRPVTDRTGWDGNGGYDAVSPACAACGSEDNAVAYPCPTIRALGGEGN